MPPYWLKLCELVVVVSVVLLSLSLSNAAPRSRRFSSACRCQTMAISGRVASGRGSGRLQEALHRGRGGAPQPAAQELLDAILQLGYLPRQAKNSTAEGKHLAGRLLKARKAGSLSSEQQAALGNPPHGAAEIQAGEGVYYD